MPSAPMRIADWLRRGGWGLAAAAAVAVCVGGHQLGMTSYRHRETATSSLAEAMSFGAIDGTDEIDLILLSSTIQEVSP